MGRANAYIVSGLEHPIHLLVHVVVIQGHEERVDDDAECDEELDERIEDQQRHVLLELEPDPATIPNAKNIDATQKRGQGLFLKRGALLIVVCRKVIDRNCILRVSKLKNAPLFFGEKSFFFVWLEAADVVLSMQISSLRERAGGRLAGRGDRETVGDVCGGVLACVLDSFGRVE